MLCITGVKERSSQLCSNSHMIEQLRHTSRNITYEELLTFTIRHKVCGNLHTGHLLEYDKDEATNKSCENIEMSVKLISPYHTVFVT